MLGLDNPIHILFLLVILLLVFGAKRLPEMGKSMGEGMRGFKDAITGDSHASPMTSATAHTPVHAEQLPPAPAPVAVEPERTITHVA
ncbi:MAG: twin-arginine translocase TatA/TatE family subunit [Solirubrobacteraceae bacterium]|jgi:sec-independent protein translocase protein TatA